MKDKNKNQKAKKVSVKADIVKSNIKESAVFAEQFMFNFHTLINQVHRQNKEALDQDTLRQAKLLFHNLQRKISRVDHKNIVKNVSMMKVKAAFKNKRIADITLLYAKQIYQTSNITNPEGFKELLSHIEKEQENVAVKGKVFEVLYAAEYAKKGCEVQFGCVEGKGGDVVIFGLNEYDHHHKTVQMKYLTGVSENKFKNHCRTAAEQLGNTRKGKKKTQEIPIKDSLREIVILVENPDHPVSRESETKLGLRLQTIFEYTPKAKNVDIVTIKTEKKVFQYQLQDIL